MKYITLLLGFSVLLFTSCEKNEEVPTDVVEENVITFVELNASKYTINTSDSSVTGQYTRFSFSEGDTVNHNDDNWDVAFSGTTIIINGGESSSENQPNRVRESAAYIDKSIMSDIKTVDVSRLIQDNEVGTAIIPALFDLEEGWAWYDYETHIVHTIPGRILVFRTHNNRYAKMEIISYYDSDDPQPSEGDYGGFYTFNYVYQSDGTTNF